MSRKDPRRTLRVPLTDTDLAALRVVARRRDGRKAGSLADALRRIATATLAEAALPDPLPLDAPVVRRLPVQLPAALRARLGAAGGDPALRLRACIATWGAREGS